MRASHFLSAMVAGIALFIIYIAFPLAASAPETSMVPASAYDATALAKIVPVASASEISGVLTADVPSSASSSTPPQAGTTRTTNVRPAEATQATPIKPVAVAHHALAQAAPLSNLSSPVHLSIPSASISAPIQGVGVTQNGEMAVPSGSSNNVGWYKFGSRPGERGTAVLDAHVFAAFKNLSKVTTGSDVYITTADNTKLHFVVTKVGYFKLSELSSSMLFTGGGGSGLNLITCAGTFVKTMDTYDHRLIVYTKFVGAL